MFECKMFIKNYSKNLILLVSSIVADPILILVKCKSFLYEKIIYFVLSALIQIRVAVIILLLKKVSSARLGESISPKTPAPQYQPIDRKKRKGKRVEDYSGDRAA